MGALSELGIKSSNAGTDSALQQALARRLRRLWKTLSAFQCLKKVQECLEVVRLTPHERVRQRLAEHRVDVPVSQFLEEIVLVVRFPVEAHLLKADDRVVDIPVEAPQLQQHIDEVPMVQTVLSTGEAPCCGAEADPHAG